MLPDDLESPVAAFTAALDRRHPGLLSALYLVGSIALGDYQVGRSNVDAVAVTNGVWGAGALADATAAQQTLDRGRHRSCVAYVTASELAADLTDPADPADPADPIDPTGRRHRGTAAAECREGGHRVAAERLVNPLTWRIVATGPVDLRGPDHPEVGSDEGALGSWAADELRHRWAPGVNGGRGQGLWWRGDVGDAVLEVCRLSAAADTGAAMSKVEAARYTAGHLPGRFGRIIEDCVGFRLGGRSSMYWGPLERRRHTIELVSELVARATDSTGPRRSAPRSADRP